MRTFSLPRHRQLGFTLLEVMLVIVLLGLAISVVIPTLMSDDSGSIVSKEARRLVMLTQLAQEYALVNGVDMGLKKNIDGYHFLLYQEGKWKQATVNKVLSPIKLSEGITFDIKPGSSVWHEALEWEQSNGFSFEQLSNSKSDLQPDLFFWASGEVSPATIELFAKNSPKRASTVQIEEHGVIALVEGARR